jgi:hypothetical protein
MTTLTTNLALTEYNSTTDGSALFSNFRADLAGVSLSSNMSKIDTWAGLVSGSFTALQGRYQPYYVPAVFVSTSYYEANGITQITSYATGLQIDIVLDTPNNDGTVTLNINALGTKTLQKIDAISGCAINFAVGDMKKGRDYLFRYNGTAFVLVSAATADMISVSGSYGNLLMTSASGTIIDSGSNINSFAPSTGSYLVNALSSGLSHESLLSAGSNISITQSTSASTTTLAVNVTGNNNEIPILSGCALVSSGSTVANILASIPSNSGGTQNNILINGEGSIFSRGISGSPSSEYPFSNDKYCLDRWVLLSQTTSASCSQQTGDTTSKYSIRLKQPAVTAQRMGILQIVEADGSYPYRGGSICLSGKVKCSSTQTIRYAILDCGSQSADVVQSIIVNDWTSSTYTPSNFFIASASCTIIASGSISSGSSAFSQFTLSGNTSNTFNNLMVFAWTSASVVQNVTVDFTEMGLYSGTTPPSWNPRSIATEENMCERYFEKHSTEGVLYGAFGFGYWGTASSGFAIDHFRVQKRVLPIMTYNTLQNMVFWIGTSTKSVTALTNDYGTKSNATFTVTCSGGGGTAGQGGMLSGAGAVTEIYYDAEL